MPTEILSGLWIGSVNDSLNKNSEIDKWLSKIGKAIDNEDLQLLNLELKPFKKLRKANKANYGHQ